MIYESWHELRGKIKDLDGDLFIAGAGNLGRIYGEYLNQSSISWAGYVDAQTFEDEVCGKTVYPYEHIRNDKGCYVLVSSTTYSKEIHTKLLNVGIQETQLFLSHEHDTRIVLDLMDEMYHVYDFLSKLEQFKNIHKGKKCFIVGNGPSLTIADLEKVQNEIAFASNTIFALYQHTTWRPVYYAVSDPAAIKTFQIENIRNSITDCRAVFTPIFSWLYLKEYEDNFDNVFFYRGEYGVDVENKKAYFSEDISKKMYSAGTVTYYLLQLAAYMGFKEIYLLGMDFTFSTERSTDGKVTNNDVVNHNSIIEKVEQQLYDFQYYVDIDYQLWGYQAAKRYADAHDIKIYNATRGGKLEVFPRVDFDTLF